MAQGAGTDAGDGEFGPAVIYSALITAGVLFHFIGFVTHYAAQRCEAAGLAERSHPRSHQDNLERLAHALVTLEASYVIEDGRLEPFRGGAEALAGVYERFKTPHGSVLVSVHDDAGEGQADGDADMSKVRICITTPASVLRAHAATGRYPGLQDLVEILELWDSLGDPNRS
jgi:hypothetical protein